MTGGFWAVFDGPNGSGKTGAMSAVATKLRNLGYDVVETREPGGTPLAEKIRALILDSSNKMDTTTQLLLFNAARRSHLQEVILPSIAAGRVVLCDRFLASSLVFQSLNGDGSKNLEDDFILDAHRLFCDDHRPHLSLYLDAPLDILRARIATRAGAGAIPDRFEEYDDSFDVAAAEKFRACGAMIDHDHVTIDATQTPEKVVEAAFEAVLSRITGNRFGAVYRSGDRWIAVMDPKSEGRHPLLASSEAAVNSMVESLLGHSHELRILPEPNVRATILDNLAA